MHPNLEQRQTRSILDDESTCRKLAFNQRKNEEQDHTKAIDEAAPKFSYEACRDVYWNPEEFSLLFGTPLWDQSTPHQRVVLNQLYWVAYFNQIISSEIATIFFNQVAAAGMYAMEDFRLICDTLDFESRQERAHINAFKTISEATEWELFGERMFTYPMRGPFTETMIFSSNKRARRFWRNLQLKAYTLLSSNNAFLASQYLLVRGLRTLNGKLIQHHLSTHFSQDPDRADVPIPSAISYYHFMDESHHFNTSKIIALDIGRSLDPPTAFEKWAINRGVYGCQRDHFHFSVAVNGLFWYEPAVFPVIFKLLRSSVFGMERDEALETMRGCFCQENEGQHRSVNLQKSAVESYRAFVDPVDHLNRANREMRLISSNSLERYLKQNQRAMKRFQRNA
jgi:hypothetical protein